MDEKEEDESLLRGCYSSYSSWVRSFGLGVSGSFLEVSGFFLGVTGSFFRGNS